MMDTTHLFDPYGKVENESKGSVLDNLELNDNTREKFDFRGKSLIFTSIL